MRALKSVLISVLLTLMSITSTNIVYANDETQKMRISLSEPIFNYIENDIDASRLEHKFNRFPLLRANTFPTKYSLKDENAVTKVKYQNPYGSCWAFATIGSAESSYKKTTGTEIDLSELQLAWFAYNNYGVSDPLGLVKDDGGEYLYSRGEKFDMPLNYGGNLEIATNVLISGIGLADESVNESLKYPSSGEPIHVGGGYYAIDERSITSKPADVNCYIGNYRVTDINWYNMKDKNEIKQALMNKGALAISYHHDDAYLTDNSSDPYYVNGGYSYYCHKIAPENHAILLVGWDDDYDANNFIVNDANDQTKSLQTPPGNGAWLCKNSWSRFWGDEGYFYISYYDKSVDDIALGCEVEKITSDNNYDLYQYDGGYSGSTENVKGAYINVANIFKAQDNIYVDKVGLSTLDADTNYEIEIYVDCDSDNPRNGTLAYKQSGNITYAGYHVIDLNNPEFSRVEVLKDKYYSIVVKYSHQNSEKVMVPVDVDFTINSKVKLHNNVVDNDLSYIGVSTDSLIKQSYKNAKIKAYTKINTNGAQYNIEYYYQNINDDNYTLKDTKEKYSLDTDVSVSPDSLEGFVLNNGKSILSGTNDGDLVLKVYYDRNKYNLTFNLDGGYFESGTNYSGQLKYEAPIVKPNENPVKSSFFFAGWDKDIPTTMPAQNLEIKAKWENNQTNYYIIRHTELINNLNKYLTKDENIITRTANVGTNITIDPNDPSLEIEGYYLSLDVTESMGETSLTKTIERGTNFDSATKFDLYYNLKQYTLKLNKGTGIKSVTGSGKHYYGESVTIDAELEDGYEFVNWTGDKTSTEKSFEFDVEDWNNGELSLTANATPITYTITYVLNSGSASNPSSYTVVSNNITLNNPTRNGYTFIGWSEGDSDVLSASVTIEKGSFGNKTYTAHWLKNEINVGPIGFVENDEVFVDGKKYIVNSDKKITLDNANKKVLTNYVINNVESGDVHTQYATNFGVFFLERQGEQIVPVHKEAFDDIVTYAGTAIRLTGKKGIRIITSVPTAKKTTLTNGTGIDGYKLFEYGAIMCWANNDDNPTLIRQDNGTYKASSGVFAASYSLASNKNVVYKQENGLTKYATVLTEGTNPFSEDQCKNDFAMRSYMILRPKDANDSNEDVIIYGGTIYRSISYVATQNKNKFTVGSDTYEYIWNLINYGYPALFVQEHETVE